MIKRLALLCCILLLPTIAAAEATTNPGDFWVGGQLGVVFTPNTNVTFTSPLFPGLECHGTLRTNTAFSAGAIIGYNFCMPYRPAWERFFGLALDFQWNQFNHPGKPTSGSISQRLMETSLLSPSWAGYSIPSWEVKVSPEAG